MNLNFKSMFSRNHIFYLGFIVVFTLLMYFNLLRFYIPITQEIIPWGDPFTYEMSYYELLNRIKYDNFSIDVVAMLQ